MKKFMAVVVVCTFSASLVGCANIQDDGKRTKTEGTLLGTGVGAGLGAAAGAIFGGSTKATLVGAGIGAGDQHVDVASDLGGGGDGVQGCALELGVIVFGNNQRRHLKPPSLRS